MVTNTRCSFDNLYLLKEIRKGLGISQKEAGIAYYKDMNHELHNLKPIDIKMKEDNWRRTINYMENHPPLFKKEKTPERIRKTKKIIYAYILAAIDKYNEIDLCKIPYLELFNANAGGINLFPLNFRFLTKPTKTNTSILFDVTFWDLLTLTDNNQKPTTTDYIKIFINYHCICFEFQNQIDELLKIISPLLIFSLPLKKLHRVKGIKQFVGCELIGFIDAEPRNDAINTRINSTILKSRIIFLKKDIDLNDTNLITKVVPESTSKETTNELQALSNLYAQGMNDNYKELPVRLDELIDHITHYENLLSGVQNGEKK